MNLVVKVDGRYQVKNELIKVVEHDELKQAVSARDLYLGLELDKRNWSRWKTENIENNLFFLQGVDYIELAIKASPEKSNPPKDYIVSIEMAKHLAMTARTKKGHEFRQYFIDLERSSLRRVEQYQAPTSMLEALKYAVKLEEEKLLLESKIEADAPKVQFAEDVEESEDAFLIGALAKVFGIKPRSFFELLRQEGFIDKKNIPYQKYIIQGLFIVKETPYRTETGIKINLTPMITGKGQLYFHRKYFSG
jgi:anti-repressor protein